MPTVDANVRKLVFEEIAHFSKTAASLLKDDHRLKADLRLVRPAIVHLAGALRHHVQTRNPRQTLITTDLETPDFTVGDTAALVQKRMGAGTRPWNTPGIGLGLLLALLCPALAGAQTIGSWPWWVGQFDVRKAFDGGKSELEPATIAYVDPGEAPSFWLVDLGVRHKGLDIAPRSPSTGAGPLVTELFLAPAFEWHKASAEPLLQASAADKMSASLLGELYFRDLLADGARSSDPPEVLFAPALYLKGTLTRNRLKHVTEASASLLASWSGSRDWMPGAFSVLGGRPFLRYLPYAGVEYFNNLAIAADSVVLAEPYSGWLGTVRLYAEVFPLRTIPVGRNRLVLTAEFCYRRPLSASVLEDALTFSTVGVTFYVDTAQTVGFSYSYESGESPRINFHRYRRSFVGFRARL